MGRVVGRFKRAPEAMFPVMVGVGMGVVGIRNGTWALLVAAAIMFVFAGVLLILADPKTKKA